MPPSERNGKFAVALALALTSSAFSGIVDRIDPIFYCHRGRRWISSDECRPIFVHPITRREVSREMAVSSFRGVDCVLGLDWELNPSAWAVDQVGLDT